MGIFDKFKKKSEMKEYPNEYSPEMRDLTRRGIELMKKAPKFSMEQISELSKIVPIRNDLLSQDIVNSKEFECRNMALQYSMAGNLDECLNYCKKGLEINPKSPYLLYMRGRTYSDLKQFENGIDDLANAVELRDDFADAWYEIGRIHQMHNDMDNAILAYGKAQQLEPEYYKIFKDNLDVIEEDVKHGVPPKFTQTLNEKGVRLVLDFLLNTPEEIHCEVTGYFAICMGHDVLPEYLLPPKNIRLVIFCESIQMVSDWVNQLSILLNDNGIPTQLNEQESIFEINTFDKEFQEWVPAIVCSPNEQE